MNAKTKAVIAFAGARDNYQLPLALSEADLLEAFVTNMYWPAGNKLLASLQGNRFARHLKRARYCQGLDDSKVRIHTGALIASCFMQLMPSLRLTGYIDESLGRKAKDLALGNNAAALCCSYYAYSAFKGQASALKHRFLFQLHPHPRSVRAILSEELERVPAAKYSLLAEPDLSKSGKNFEELCSEPHLANGCIVASTFTARTLIENGISSERVRVVPYGVDSQVYVKRARPPGTNQPFTIIWVGSMIQRKGLSYLLDAARHLGPKNVRILLCGRGVIDRNLLNQYRDVNPEIHIGLSKVEIVRLLHESDVFVLPSLAEGFAHVILEAMSCGVPVISTPHTCAPDVIRDGVDGFIVSIRDPMAIAEKLDWGIRHRFELAAMGNEAAIRARTFTWAGFRSGIRDSYKELLAMTQ